MPTTKSPLTRRVPKELYQYKHVPKGFDLEVFEQGQTNRRKASFAIVALTAYGLRIGAIDKEGNLNEELDTLVTDLIADLHHFCLAHGLDLEHLVSKGYTHFSEENSEAVAAADREATKRRAMRARVKK